MTDYTPFRAVRYGVLGIASDGSSYLRSLLKDDEGGSALAESIISKSDENRPVDVPSEFFAAGAGWPQMIKSLRAIYGISIAEAQDLALRHPGWLRWVKRRCASDRSCMKQARHAARAASLPDWLVLEDGKTKFIR